MLTIEQLQQRRAEFIQLREQAIGNANKASGHIEECDDLIAYLMSQPADSAPETVVADITP